MMIRPVLATAGTCVFVLERGLTRHDLETGGHGRRADSRGGAAGAEGADPRRLHCGGGGHADGHVGIFWTRRCNRTSRLSSVDMFLRVLADLCAIPAGDG